MLLQFEITYIYMYNAYVIIKGVSVNVIINFTFKGGKCIF